jgi:hypothetical protein
MNKSNLDEPFKYFNYLICEGGYEKIVDDFFTIEAENDKYSKVIKYRDTLHFSYEELDLVTNKKIIKYKFFEKDYLNKILDNEKRKSYRLLNKAIISSLSNNSILYFFTEQNNFLNSLYNSTKIFHLENYIVKISRYIEKIKARYLTNKKPKITEKVKKTKEKIIKSFELNIVDVNGIKIENLFYSLKKSFLKNKVNSLHNFKKVFNGVEIKNKIIWCKTHTELAYFIKYIHKKFLVYTKQKIWDITIYCFGLENKTILTNDKLRGAGKPTNFKEIENIINSSFN